MYRDGSAPHETTSMARWNPWVSSGRAGGKTNAARYAVCDENGPRSIPVEGLLPGSASA
jgi:hypothetical protein